MGLKVEWFACPASSSLQMPQYFKIYAPGPGISKHNILAFIEKSTSAIIVEARKLANMKQGYSKRLETKRL